MWQEALAEITGALGANANERWHSTLLMSAYLSRDNTSLIKPSRLNCFSVCSLFRVPTHSSIPPLKSARPLFFVVKLQTHTTRRKVCQLLHSTSTPTFHSAQGDWKAPNACFYWLGFDWLQWQEVQITLKSREINCRTTNISRTFVRIHLAWGQKKMSSTDYV